MKSYISNTNIKKLLTIQNVALHIASNSTQDTNTQHLHDKTSVPPRCTHLQLHATQLKQMTQTQTHHCACAVSIQITMTFAIMNNILFVFL